MKKSKYRIWRAGEAFESTEVEYFEAVCERHGPYKAGRITICGHTIGSACPICYEEHEAAYERRFKRNVPDDGLSDAERRRAMAANIKPEFYQATLDNYRAETPSQMQALTACRSLVKQKKGFVALAGTYGVGKTHLACAVARELGGSVYTMFELAARIRSSFDAKSPETEADVLRSLCTAPFLAIDEFGRSKGQEAEANWLSHIVATRHSCFLPTMILSNRRLASELPGEKWRESLEAVLGDDVAQRVMSSGTIIAIDGPNARLTQKGFWKPVF